MSNTAIPRKRATTQSTIDKIADEDISALKLVVATSLTKIKLADKDLFANSKVLGVAITSGLTGSKIKVITFGEILDGFFNFTLNEPIYLGDNGTIEQSAPVSGQVVTIGHGLGAGGIFVNIDEPIIDQ